MVIDEGPDVYDKTSWNVCIMGTMKGDALKPTS
jgi:hypothetical protein